MAFEFSQPIISNNMTLPDGQITLRPEFPVQPFREKYFASRLPQITSIVVAIPSHKGAFRDRHERWCGMRWTQQRRAWKGIAGWASACERSPSRRRPALIRLR